MLTLPTTWGFRCGASRRSTRSCSRSASLMITWVYSVSARDSISISSSCAAPRIPPSGFLISWARFLISSLVASACSSARSSRSWRFCCSISTISKTTLREPSIWLTVTWTGRRLALAAGGALQERLEPARRERVVADRGDRLAQHLRLDEPVEHQAARHAAPRQAEHGLERRIGELAFAFGGDDGDHRRQQVERGLRGRLAGGCRRRLRGNHCGGGSFLISRWSAATSVCLRAIAARISSTRSRYFW